MHRPRVLVVDDSVVVRRLVSKALEAEGEVEVVGVAADGMIALANIERLHPDIVILDVAMPVMDGLAALSEIRQRWPVLPVIMFSTLTSRGAEVTLDALALGASDYVLKPSAGDAGSSMAKIREELLPRIAALLPQAKESQERTPTRLPERPSRASGQVRRASGPLQRVDLIAIGVSTGGPTALAELIPSLPADLPVPVAIVQHMPPMFTKILAERLDSKSPLRVAEAADGDRLRSGSVYVAPGDLHLAIAKRDRDHLHVYDGPHENSCRPSVDPLFRSVADRFGPHALGIVMTGMGSDGLRGAEHLAAAGGRLLVQDEASSVVWGMPGFVARAGLADAALPLAGLRGEILRRVAVGRDPAALVEAGAAS
jgi:two-component system chemotaxis response regulator CheB